MEEEPAVDCGVNGILHDELLSGGTGDDAVPVRGWRAGGGY